MTMSCGCPTEPGGLWNADNITVSALVSRDGKVAGQATLRYAGEPSTYEAALPALDPGTYALEVLASDPTTGNSGRDVRPIVVEPRGRE